MGSKSKSKAKSNKKKQAKPSNKNINGNSVADPITSSGTVAEVAEHGETPIEASNSASPTTSSEQALGATKVGPQITEPLATGVSKVEEADVPLKAEPELSSAELQMEPVIQPTETPATKEVEISEKTSPSAISDENSIVHESAHHEQDQHESEGTLDSKSAELSLNEKEAPKTQQSETEYAEHDAPTKTEVVTSNKGSIASHHTSPSLRAVATASDDSPEPTPMPESKNEADEIEEKVGEKVEPRQDSEVHVEEGGLEASNLELNALKNAPEGTSAPLQNGLEINDHVLPPSGTEPEDDLDADDFYASLQQEKKEEKDSDPEPQVELEFATTESSAPPDHSESSLQPSHGKISEESAPIASENESSISPDQAQEKSTFGDGMTIADTKVDEHSSSEDDGDDDFFRALTSEQNNQPESGGQEEKAPDSPKELPEQKHDGLQLDLDDDDDFLDDGDGQDDTSFIDHPAGAKNSISGDTAKQEAGALSFLDSDEDLLPEDEEPVSVKTGQQTLADAAPLPSNVRPRPSIAEFHTEQKGFDLPMEIMPQQKARHQAPRVISRTGTPQTPGPISTLTYAPASQEISPRTSTTPRPPPAFARPARPSRAASTKSKYAPTEPVPESQAYVPNPLNPPPPNPFSQSAISGPLESQQQIPHHQLAPQQNPQQQKKTTFVRQSNPDPFGFPDLPSSAVPKRAIRAAPSRDSLQSATPPVGSNQPIPPPSGGVTSGNFPPPGSVPPGVMAGQRKLSAPLRAKSSTGGSQSYLSDSTPSAAPQTLARAQSYRNTYTPEPTSSHLPSSLSFSSQEHIPSGSLPPSMSMESSHQSSSTMGFASPQREHGTGAVTPQPFYDPTAAYSTHQQQQQPITEGFGMSPESALPPAPTISKLPLPLLGPKGVLKNKTKDVEKWIDERTSQLGLSFGSLLYRVVQHLASPNQAEIGQLIRDTLQDYRKDVPFAPFSAQPSATPSEVSSLIFGKLVAHDRMQALQAALDSRAYSHAMLIAKSLGSEQWQTAVEEFVAEEARKAAAPLAFIYRALAADSVEAGASAISEMKPRGETSHIDVNKVDAQLVHWAGCASALYDSVAGSDESSPAAAALKELGKLLVQRNFVEEGHVCFVICKVPLGSLPEFSLPLTNEHKPPHFDSYVLAEIYESILGRGSPALLPRKLEFATTLSGMGFHSEALRIAETVAQVLKATKGAPQPLLDGANALVEQCSATSSPSGGWLNRKLSKPQFSKAFNKFVSGDDDEVPAPSSQVIERHLSHDSGLPPANMGFVPPPRQSFTPGPDHRSASPSIAVHYSRPKSSATSRQIALTEVAEENGSLGEPEYPPRSGHDPSFAQQQLAHPTDQRVASPHTDLSKSQYTQGVPSYPPLSGFPVSAHPYELPHTTSASAPSDHLQSVSPAFSEPAQPPSLYQTDAQAPPLMMPPSVEPRANSVFGNASSSVSGPVTQFPPAQGMYDQQQFGYPQMGQHPNGPLGESNTMNNPYSVGPSPSLSSQTAMAGPYIEHSGQNFAPAHTMPPVSAQPRLAPATGKYDPVYSQPETVPMAQSQLMHTQTAQFEPTPEVGPSSTAANPPNEAGKKDTNPQDDGTKKKGWFSWLKKEDNNPNKPIEVKLGGSTQMYFDKELGRWVSKDGPKPEPKKGPPPPPKAATVTRPATSTTPYGNTAPLAATMPSHSGAFTSSAPATGIPPDFPQGVPQGVPPVAPQAETVQTSVTSASPPAVSSGFAKGGIDGILAAANAGKGKRRPARSRYVGTTANGMPQGL